MPIRCVLFDATGTLIELREEVGETYSRHASAHGVDLPAWRLSDAFRRVLRHAPARVFPDADAASAADSERMWWRERVRQTFQAADSTIRLGDFDGDFDDFFDGLYRGYASQDAWRLREGVRAALDGLSREGIALGVVSDFDHRLPGILDELEIARFFAVIALPHAHGVRKPGAQLFDAALSALACDAGQTAYVGDDEEAVLLAIERLGIRTVDVRTLADFAELPAQLKRLATLSSPARTAGSPGRQA